MLSGMAFSFSIEKSGPGLARVGRIETPHGAIETPAFIPVATKATIKALTVEQVRSLGAQAVLGNTYHLYLQPGDALIQEAGGFGPFMNWQGPTFTDSGGFQVFSLGVAYGKKVSKFEGIPEHDEDLTEHVKLASVDEEGVTFRSHIDGTTHRFTPERSMEIQHNLGADILFAFDEIAAPLTPVEGQRIAMDRTHRWARRCLDSHETLSGKHKKQALFGIVQGGRYDDLRAESAHVLAGMDFDGYGIGGTFTKKDLITTLAVVNKILPEEKPRHLLGIGEPEDLFIGVENGIDTFDCVAATRMARGATLYTKHGTVNIENEKYRTLLEPLEEGCDCYTCRHYTAAYLSHLYRAHEMLAATLGSIHNLRFIVRLVDEMRDALRDNTFGEIKESFLKRYLS